MHLHLAARALGIHGPALFLNNARASGLYALEAAADQLRMGRCKLALAAAAESPHFPTKYLWFREAGVYSLSGRLRPFDRDRDGLVLGAGSAAVALETLEAAEARGARILAEYLGGASSQEGWKVAVPNLTERYYEETLRAALRAARVEPGEIDLLNPHGAGTPLGDRAEAMGIAAVFGPWPARPRVTCFKPCLGHTLGASALLETVALLLCMEHGVAPATPGFEREDPALRVRCLARNERADLRMVLKMSCGFAGFNAGAVFRRYEP
jgi:3-oxoacyl-(acyl-carrier-protein) synthase